MKVNGAPLQSNFPSIIMDGTTLVPLRALAESLHANVVFDPITNGVDIQGADVPGLRQQVAGLQQQLVAAQSEKVTVDQLNQSFSTWNKG